MKLSVDSSGNTVQKFRWFVHIPGLLGEKCIPFLFKQMHVTVVDRLHYKG